MTRSEAIRAALVEAASRLSDKQVFAAEVAALEADEDDWAEMSAVADSWSDSVSRGDIFALRLPKGGGPDQHGARFWSCGAVRRIPSSLGGLGGAHVEKRSIGILPTGD